MAGTYTLSLTVQQTGTVTYTFATNRTADCGPRDTCQDIQRFNGTHPPRVSP